MNKILFELDLRKQSIKKSTMHKLIKTSYQIIADLEILLLEASRDKLINFYFDPTTDKIKRKLKQQKLLLSRLLLSQRYSLSLI